VEAHPFNVHAVTRGLDPRVHAVCDNARSYDCPRSARSWIAGSSPAMTLPLWLVGQGNSESL
jgi:hypothetical protein